jgi:hypothetical protein
MVYNSYFYCNRFEAERKTPSFNNVELFSLRTINFERSEIGKTAERNQGNKLMNIRVVNNNKEKYIITNKLDRILAPLLSELKSRFFFVKRVLIK